MAVFCMRIHDVFTHLQGGGSSSYEEAQRLSHQGSGGGQSHEKQISARFWRLRCHPVNYSTVYYGTYDLCMCVEGRERERELV